MSRTLTGTFFNELWHEENRLDILRARELTAEARRKLATMTREEFLADAAQNIREADRLLLGELFDSRK